MNPRLARVPVPFRWSVRDGVDGNRLVARSYNTELEGVLSRTSVKWVPDRNGLLVPQVHSVAPVAWVGGEPALLLEPQRTNLCVRSEEFDNASWSKSPGVSVTADAIAAPNGIGTADLLTDSGSVATNQCTGTITFTGDGEKCFALYVKAGTAAVTDISMYDTTALAHRHQVRLTWTAGVPTLTTVLGTGTRYPVEALANGWYRILFSGAGVIAANSNRFIIYPTGGGTATAGTVYVWGAQAEDAVVPSSYIPTAASTVTRQADSLYFPLPTRPQALTLYARGIERGYRYSLTTPRFLHIGAGSTAEPRILLYTTPGGNIQTYHHNSVDSAVTAGINAAARVLGDVLEARGLLFSDGSVRTGQSINGAAETLSAQSAAPASGLAAAFAGERLYFNGFGVNEPIAMTHAAIALGERTMDETRALAGV